MFDPIELREIETYLRCPRQHWFRYQLQLRGGRDYGYYSFRTGAYSALSAVVDEWNRTQRTPSPHTDYLKSFQNAWPEDEAKPWDGRDRYRRERVTILLEMFVKRLAQLEAKERPVHITVLPRREMKLALPTDGNAEAVEIKVVWTIGHTEAEEGDTGVRAYLHKFSRRKSSHLVQADHFALTLLPATGQVSTAGIWYPLLTETPDPIEISSRSAETARLKIVQAVLGILEERKSGLDYHRPSRCEEEETCRQCHYRYNCFDE